MQLERPESKAVLGGGPYVYDVLDGFPRLPPGKTMTRVAAVAVDRNDNLYVFVREGTAPIMVFNRNGDFLDAWGRKEDFVNPHALHIGRDDMIYCTDDFGHSVRKFTLEGKPMLTLGIPGKPAPHYGGKPFCRCTHTALSPENDIYVSDGYWNACVHKFSPEGKHLFSWGGPGREPGEFNIPHNIGCDDDGWVYVADRENHRVQIFDGRGNFQSQIKYVHRPCGMTVDMTSDGFCYVGELGPGYPQTNGRATNLGPRISVLSKKGEIVARMTDEPDAPPSTRLFVPHSLCFDAHGDLYVADTMSTWSYRYPEVPQPPGLGVVKKFVRRRP